MLCWDLPHDQVSLDGARGTGACACSSNSGTGRDLDEGFMDLIPLILLPLCCCGDREGFPQLLQGLYAAKLPPHHLVSELQASSGPQSAWQSMYQQAPSGE